MFGSWSGPAAAPLSRSVPLRVHVPSVGIDAPLIRLGLDRDGAVAVPPMSVPTEAGWFTGDPTPGERGAAVIVGHVDTDYGRAVFYPLGNVQPGALVIVDRADKKHAQFRVTSVEVVDKDRFPARAGLRRATTAGRRSCGSSPAAARSTASTTRTTWWSTRSWSASPAEAGRPGRARPGLRGQAARPRERRAPGVGAGASSAIRADT